MNASRVSEVGPSLTIAVMSGTAYAVNIASRHGFRKVIYMKISFGLSGATGLDAISGLAITILKSRIGIATVPSGSRFTSDVSKIIAIVSVEPPDAVMLNGLTELESTEVSIERSC